MRGYIVLLGVLACFGWLYIGQDDDAPGAGMIGIIALLSAIVVAFRLRGRAAMQDR